MRSLFLWALFSLVICLLALYTACGSNDDGDDDSADNGSDDDTDGAYGTGDVWLDSESGLTWQSGEDVGAKSFTWQQAVDYCDKLDWGGYTDWRLPSISELRTLIRGCAGTISGGPCGVTDFCRQHNGCWNDMCMGCQEGAGPGADGMYWPSQITGQCCFYWSKSKVSPDNKAAWEVQFDNGLVGTNSLGYHLSARCVRD